MCCFIAGIPCTQTAKKKKTTAWRFAVKYCKIILALLGSLMFYLWIVGKYSSFESHTEKQNKKYEIVTCVIWNIGLHFSSHASSPMWFFSKQKKKEKMKTLTSVDQLRFCQKIRNELCPHCGLYVINNGTCAAKIVVRLIHATHTHTVCERRS